jgi:hypothetical protein
MKTKANKLLRVLQVRARSHLGWSIALAIGLLAMSPTAKAGGLGDIASLLKTITSTIQDKIGGALRDIQKVDTLLNRYRQQIVWPLSAISQAKAFVMSTRSQYGQLMQGIGNIRNHSATLVEPAHLESLFRSGQSGMLSTMQPAYTSVYNSVPADTKASSQQRNMMDMDDSFALGSLKATVLSDQTTASLLTMADQVEQDSASTSPGSGELIATQAHIAELETQALMAKVLAAELRAEAGKLAHDNALFKQSSGAARNLQNQLKQVISQP